MPERVLNRDWPLPMRSHYPEGPAGRMRSHTWVLVLVVRHPCHGFALARSNLNYEAHVQSLWATKRLAFLSTKPLMGLPWDPSSLVQKEQIVRHGTVPV